MFYKLNPPLFKGACSAIRIKKYDLQCSYLKDKQREMDMSKKRSRDDITRRNSSEKTGRFSDNARLSKVACKISLPRKEKGWDHQSRDY
ncbi:hypothetical protein IEQ34_003179 [Dendrobium chrysotoxum]|uniref:Uncharacterized protein n=1 Tax=Dendrobium chrysotoxum TaxID=161865 RepID=A0AAV7HGJ8_DENCH|nr:hypothetical protein IEQ34_003179 [Dendrobium chrysotoxum]